MKLWSGCNIGEKNTFSFFKKKDATNAMLLEASPKKSGPGGLSGTEATASLVCHLGMSPPASCSPLASKLPKTLLRPVPTACQVLTRATQGHHIMSPTCLSGFISHSPFSLEVQTLVACFQPSLTSKLTLGIFFFYSYLDCVIF